MAERPARALVLGIDQGTSGSKAMLLDEHSVVRGICIVAFKQDGLAERELPAGRSGQQTERAQ